MATRESGRISTRIAVDKYLGDFRNDAEALEAGAKPYESSTSEHNVFLNEGINALWTLICGGSETAFNNTNARVGVGNSNTAESASQTGLQGASTAFASMDTGYPTYGSDQKATFKGTFGSGQAEFAWEEFTVDNGATANRNLNRKTSSKGTKGSGETWVLTIELSIS
jgi:hypothetical protein